MQCGNPAKHTQRLIANEDLIVVGAAGMYEARCRRCFEPDLSAMEANKKKQMELVTAVGRSS
jgi:thymidine kinase